MSILVSAHQLSKTYGVRALFSGVTFSVDSNDRIGLIGPNGAGKSTLLKIIAQQTTPDNGTLSLSRGLKVGYLEQVPLFAPDATISETILEGCDDPYEWENIALCEELTSKFELDRFPPEKPIRELSGGWKKRVALARELLKKPDLLLLDEPTNHLDVESILWLEELLSKARFAVLAITHDRLFLQRIANRILELDARHEGGLLSVAGDYAQYLETREQLIAAQERREVILKNTLRRETEWLRQGAKARTTKQQARIQRQGELSDAVDQLTTRNQVRSAQIDFQSADRNPKKLVEAKGISVRYGDRTLFAPLDLRLGPGMRLGLMGQNGSGKSTLIRVLLGLEAPTQGTVERAENLSIAYFDQTREALDPSLTVAKTLCPLGEYVDYRGTRVHIRSYLDKFLFTTQQMDMPVGKLSGGEQSRILIARLMLTRANLLVLDEPTNDLDMATLSVLEECLTEFSGAVLLVTHDRYFLDQVATQLLAFPAEGQDSSGKLVAFADLAQWEDWHRSRAKAAAGKNAPQKPVESPPAVVAAPTVKPRKLTFKDQRELDSMEANIQEAEALLEKLSFESAAPENLGNAKKLMQLTADMAATQEKIDRLYERWQQLTAE